MLDNPHGVYDSHQIMKLSSKEEFQDFWQHNTFILEGKTSPFEMYIQEISDDFFEKKKEILKDGSSRTSSRIIK